MLHTMLVTGVTPLQNKDEINNWENRPFYGAWTEKNTKKTDITRNRTIQKKSKRIRTAYTTDQLKALEKTFQLTKYINSEKRQDLSRMLNIGEKCIKIWFQNRRMKEKRESSDSSDSSSETVRSEVMSPSLVNQTDPEVLVDQQNQYVLPTYHDPYTYFQSPVFQSFGLNKVEALPDNTFKPIHDYNNGMSFNEMNPYPVEYYPSGKIDVNNAYVQNQYQYDSEMYNWYTNNTDFSNYYQ